MPGRKRPGGNNNPNRLRSANRNRTEEGEKSIWGIDFPTRPTNRNNNNSFRLASTLTGRLAAFMGADSDHELRPTDFATPNRRLKNHPGRKRPGGPAMTIKRRSGLHVVGAPPSCRAYGPGRRPPLPPAQFCAINSR